MKAKYWHVSIAISFITSLLQYHRIACVQTRLMSPDDHDAYHPVGSRILELTFAILGLGLVILSVVLPILMEATLQPRRALMSGYLRLLMSFIADASVASSFIAIVVILSFEKTKANVTAVLFGILTLSVFTAEIALSLYLSLVRPLAASSELAIYVLIGLIPFGLGCTMFTLASSISAG
jgi:hypothetical protein